MRPLLLPLALAAFLVGGCALATRAADPVSVRQEVMERERAFARTMADRDHAAFITFLSEEAIFFSGEEAIRGRAAVASAWRAYFDGADPPFAWEPDQVQVLDSGSLALSTGPVFDPAGRVVARFTTIWRREGGAWRVVFDRGSPVCEC